MTAFIDSDAALGGGTLAAFAPDGEVRGVVDSLPPPFGPYAGKPLYLITMYADAGGEELSFKFKSADGTVYPLVDKVTFQINGKPGDIFAPIIFTVSAPPPAPVCADKSPGEVAAWAESLGYGPGRTCAEGKQFGLCATNPGMKDYCAATCEFC